MKVPVHDEPHRARTFRIRFIEDRLNHLILFSTPTVGRALKTLVREDNARMGRTDDHGTHPFKLLWRNPVDRGGRGSPMVVAFVEVDVFSRCLSEVVRIADDKAKTAFVEEVMSVRHAVGVYRLLRGAVLVMVSEDVIRGDVKIVVGFHVGAFRRLRDVVDEVAEMDDHVTSFPSREPVIIFSEKTGVSFVYTPGW